ncbi:hypothetical protein EV361DRAFT_870506 [Lentinula raphanica]|nr:hypothetical protein EV361DRAFT_870506 [Lentinula raphanica]
MNTLANLQILSTSVDDVQPIQRFRLFTGEFHSRVTKLEFCWGIEKGELDLWSPLNSAISLKFEILVRANVARLFLDWELALIPTNEILKKLADTIEANIDGHIDQRRSCFEVLPPGEYEYDLVPLRMDPPNLLVIEDGSTSPRKLELASPHHPRLKLDVHPAFAVIHGAYKLYPDIHKSQRYYDPMLRVSMLCCERVPREFYARPDFRTLVRRHVSGQKDDQRSSESDESEDIPADADYPSEDGAIRIQSWLEAVPKSGLIVEQVSGKSGRSEADSFTDVWPNTSMEDI